ncbi:substrate-binding and VWA domain-containing protein [Rhodococcus sp. IEGM 1354]|uniref:substrate-binding and VWA domain-containing protein n=1 Tax=Rhodococcus sp. IEGM 1354 TaxID=3047088 RepID=UPI0024B6A7F3|nr:substrate-binding and VWA domain-containing protein [Rhodococcus sp. IEGM 1354]MDI9930830.1 substrate-binding and VWA domain-containing protein [Rhodococcus sp. IEGM 1354]
MIVVLTIAVLVAAVFGWFALRDRISDQGIEAADTCVEGPAVLTVAADPDISAAIEQLATRFDATAPVIRDHCVTVEVRAIASDAVRVALNSGTDNWDDAALGARPGLWIPQSSAHVEAVVDRGAIDGTPRPLASSPIVLAAPGAVADAVVAAGSSWADLIRLQRDPQALGLPEWGGLRLALPSGSDTGASTLAVAAIAAGVRGDSTTALTVDEASSTQLVSAMSELAVTDTGAAATSASTTYDALAALENAAGPDAAVHAVPVTEQQLASTDSSTLTVVRPQGATPVADHPAVVLSGDETSTRAAAAFVDFVRQPDGTQTLSDAGFSVDQAQDSGIVAPPSGRVADALLAVLRNPVLPRRATVLLDVSESMGTTEGGATRLQNTVRALSEQFRRVPDATELGLWSFSEDLNNSLPFRVDVPTGPMTVPVGTTPRRSALDSTAAALTPAAGSFTYASVLVAYLDAVAGYVPGRVNSVVLITDGTDDSPLSADQLLSELTSASDPARPVAVNIVRIGDDSPARAFTDIASRTGGTVDTVPTSDSPDLLDRLGKLLY